MKRFITLLLTLYAVLLQPLAANASYFPETAIKSSTKASYMAASTFVAPAASTTDLFEIYGSSTKTVKVLRVELAYKASTGPSATDECFLLRRSTANSSGTSVTLGNLKLDTNNSSATAVAKSYTANPTTGTLVGRIATRIATPSTPTGGDPVTAIPASVLFDANVAGQPIVLRGTSEGLVVNFNGTIPSGGTPRLAITFYWTEE